MQHSSNTDASVSELHSVTLSNVGTVFHGTEEEALERYRAERTSVRYDVHSRSFLSTVSLFDPRGSLLYSWSPSTDEDGETSERYYRSGHSEEESRPVPTLLDSLRSLEGTVYSLSAGWNDDADELEDGGSASWSQLDSLARGADVEALARSGELLVFVPSYCSGSDYNGGALVRSNVKALEELADGEELVHWMLHGGHGTHGIAFPLWERSEELVRVLEGLGNYPVVDESLMSELESEEETEAWDNWVRSDFTRALESATGVDLSEVADSELSTLFYERMQETSTYFEHTDEGPHIDVEALADDVEREELLSLPGAVSETLEEETRARDILRTVTRRLGTGPVPFLEASGDMLPILRTYERTVDELARFRVYDVTEGKGADAVSLLRQLGDVTLPAPLDADASSVTLQKRVTELETLLSRIQDHARSAVLPMLEDSADQWRGRTATAERWKRDAETGELVSDAFRNRVTSELREEALRRDTSKSARRKTYILRSWKGEEESVERMRQEGKSVADAVRSILLARVRARVSESKSHGLPYPAGGWGTVEELTEESVTLRRKVAADAPPSEDVATLSLESLIRTASDF
jgi:hypothetical protein